MIDDPNVYSVKQIEMFINCPRRWAGHYLFGYEQFQSETGAFGAEVHAECARLGRCESLKDPDGRTGKLAREMVQYVHGFRDDGTLFEVDFKVRLRDKLFSLRGDVVCYELARFYDYKTTGAPHPQSKLENGKFWALQSLEKDIQANTYAGLLLLPEDAEHDAWDATWIYGSKKFGAGNTPRCWAVDHRFWRGHVEAFWDQYIWPAVDTMSQLRQAHAEKLIDTIADVPQDWDSCERSGKFCDIAGRCRNRKSEITLVQLGIKHPERKR